MSRLIDADRLYEVIKNSWDTSDAEDFEKSVFVALATAPTIEERKTGKWIKNSNGTYSCDKCHSWIPNEQHYYANFCLYCGAVMIGGEECTKKI